MIGAILGFFFFWWCVAMVLGYITDVKESESEIDKILREDAAKRRKYEEDHLNYLFWKKVKTFLKINPKNKE